MKTSKHDAANIKATEITDLRAPCGKAFRLPLGTSQYIVYAADIHCLASDGTYHEIDNNLIAGKDGSGCSVYQVTENPAMYCCGAANAPYVMSVQCHGRILRWRFPEDVLSGNSVIQEPTVPSGIGGYEYGPRL